MDAELPQNVKCVSKQTSDQLPSIFHISIENYSQFPKKLLFELQKNRWRQSKHSFFIYKDIFRFLSRQMMEIMTMFYLEDRLNNPNVCTSALQLVPMLFFFH